MIDKLRLFARSADFSLTPGLRSTQGTEIAAAISQKGLKTKANYNEKAVSNVTMGSYEKEHATVWGIDQSFCRIDAVVMQE